jgi:hypothetical protein
MFYNSLKYCIVFYKKLGCSCMEIILKFSDKWSLYLTIKQYSWGSYFGNSAHYLDLPNVILYFLTTWYCVGKGAASTHTRLAFK